MKREQWKAFLPVLFFVILLGMANTNLGLWWTWQKSLGWVLALGVIPFVARGRNREHGLWLVLLGLGCLTTLAFHPNYYFLKWIPKGRGVFLVGTLLFTLVLWKVRDRAWLTWALGALFVCGELAAVIGLLRLTGLEALYRDDHPSFLFRLEEFWTGFPWREHYVPHWNAGVVHNVLTSSGVPGYALLTTPLRCLFAHAHEYHTLGLAWVQAILVPWAAVWGFRACRVDWRATWMGALLVLFANRTFFLWTFHFGTVGAGVAWAMAPVALLFLYAIAEKGRTDWQVWLGLVTSCVFVCLWPQMWIFAVFLAVAVLTSCRTWFPQARMRWALLGAVAVIVLLLLPSLIAVVRERELLTYTTQGSQRGERGQEILRTLVNYTSGDLVLRMNPLVLVLGLCGVWTLPQRPLRRWMAVLMVGCVLTYSVGSVLAPNMQLYRMTIPLALVLAVPAAAHMEAIWKARTSWSLPLQGATLALLVLGVLNIGFLYHGEGNASFSAIPPVIREMGEWLKTNVPQGTRVLFAGHTSHAYGHGHVAYLPILAECEMMACDYYSFPVGTVERDFPPKAARGGPGGLYGFMMRHGVSHVVTCRENYIDFMNSEPEHFAPATAFTYSPEVGGPVEMRIYRVLGSKGVFLEGEGSVTSDFDRIRLTLSDPLKPVVLAYHWNDRLRAPEQVTLEPYETEGGECFIKVHAHGLRNVEIRYENRF